MRRNCRGFMFSLDHLENKSRSPDIPVCNARNLILYHNALTSLFGVSVQAHDLCEPSSRDPFSWSLREDLDSRILVSKGPHLMTLALLHGSGLVHLSSRDTFSSRVPLETQFAVNSPGFASFTKRTVKQNVAM